MAMITYFRGSGFRSLSLDPPNRATSLPIVVLHAMALSAVEVFEGYNPKPKITTSKNLNVILSARSFVGITSRSVGNCTVTSCLVAASNVFLNVHCTGMLMLRTNNSIAILITYYFTISYVIFQ